MDPAQTQVKQAVPHGDHAAIRTGCQPQESAQQNGNRSGRPTADQLPELLFAKNESLRGLRLQGAKFRDLRICCHLATCRIVPVLRRRGSSGSVYTERPTVLGPDF